MDHSYTFNPLPSVTNFLEKMLSSLYTRFYLNIYNLSISNLDIKKQYEFILDVAQIQ